MISKFTISACAVAMALSCTAQSRDATARNVQLRVQSCDFKFVDMFNGFVDKPDEENNFKSAGYSATIRVSGSEKSFGFSFMCYSNVMDVNEVARDYGGHYKSELNRWFPAYPGATADEISRLRKVTKALPLISKNDHGFYTIQDETVGEPDRRIRHLSYCLFHKKKAICGLGEVKRLIDPKSDMLPYALRILRSVEFVDTASQSITEQTRDRQPR